MSIYGIIVLYNKAFNKTSYKALMDNGVSLIVCDNSTRTMGNEAEVSDAGAYYIPMGGK